jgi:replicative DNA helicase
METSLLEKLIIKGVYENPQYLALVSTIYQKNYFDDPVVGKIFSAISDHFKQYGQVIPEASFSGDPDAKVIFDEIRSLDFDIIKNYDFLYSETESHLKEHAVKSAIIDSVDIIDGKKDVNIIRTTLEDALCKSLKVDIGLEYFVNIGERLRKAFASDVTRIPSYFPQLDEYINGGFPPYTLNVVISRIHGFKSAMMANMSARQVLQGHNVVVMTLEMSEEMYAQRYDGIYSGLNINRMYLDKALKTSLMKSLSIKATENKGKLFIKQFATGKASVNDFRIYLRELTMRHIKPSILFCDYLNLMKVSYLKKTDMYSDIKNIAEELRALSMEFDCPVFSVSQLNRPGSDDLPLAETDIVHISESLGLPATCDSLFIFGNDKDLRTYENEIHYKVVKNRLGGRVGEINKLFFDANSLTIYDSSELDIWRGASLISGDQRRLKDKKVEMPRSLGKRSRGKKEDDE